MTPPKVVGRMTIDEYFDFEERTRSKHEYVDGDVFEMSGVTRRHSAIVGNVTYDSGITLTLDEIYEDVTMPTLEQQLRLREEEAAYF